MARAEVLTHYVKWIDKDLFVQKQGEIHVVCRNSVSWESFEFDGKKLLCSRRVPQYIFAITDTFTQSGKPIDMGIEPLLQRIKSIDGHGDFNASQHVISNLEKDLESTAKDQTRMFEDLAYEVQPMFKKAFGDVLTHSFEKKDKRRLKNGSH
jgi:hypothetical protein